MDLSEAVFTSIDAIRAADTGAGGLNEANGVALVNKMVLRDDANYGEDRADYWPHLMVDVIERSDTTWGTVNSRDTEQVFVRITLRTQRDPGRAKQNAVSARMRTVFDGVIPAAQTGWFFGVLTLERGYQVRATGNVLVYVQEYSIRAGVTAAEVTGRQTSLTFTGSDGAAIGSTMYGQSIDEDTQVVMAKVDHFDDAGERLTRQDFQGTINAVFTMSSMSPVIPVGTQGILVVFENTAANKKITYTNAVVVRRRVVADTDENSPQVKIYVTFRVSSAGVAGTLAAVAT